VPRRMRRASRGKPPAGREYGYIRVGSAKCSHNFVDPLGGGRGETATPDGPGRARQYVLV